MSKRTTISARTRKVVAIKSGGEDCIDSLNKLLKNNTFVGEYAHIEAASRKGPRANENNLNDNSAENLILINVENHVLIDRNPEEFTTEILKSIKYEHEKEIYEAQKKFKEKMKDKSFENFKKNEII